MAGKKSDLGPTGKTVTRNVRRLREARGLSYAGLSRRLADMRREIPPLGLRRIESGERRVDADDLVALAIALGVTPITLLMPYTETEDTPVEVTGWPEPIRDRTLWSWLEARDPLSADVGDDSMHGWLAFVLATSPTWMVRGIDDAVRRGLDGQRARLALDMQAGKALNRAANRREDG
ncbi:helix-turn-helix domain-containing protein [Mycobacterium interjectum]|uniref:helix-turn-helix domain-containing protein n=1 Tax=Mycobacterium interjectum TaxID=33895 RepID=UPI00082C3ABF|nr:helix-turn-helix transcriptional regulator [Mycobacterium interjectum]MCV7090070.1 helix-turn-helix transcriptional regulator [Mycobacterium interjectum]